MNDLLEVLDLEIRIATTAAVRTQLESARIQRDHAASKQPEDELRLRALTDELISLRAQQIDQTLSGRSTRRG